MDGYRDHPGDFDAAEAQSAAAADVAVAIGSDERRMHVRAYNYWASLLHGRDYPSIEDLEPSEVTDFADNSVLLDFTAGRDNPATPYIGSAIRAECGLGEGIRSIADVPGRSLLSRLTDHYLQIIANRAPVGFEAEFVNQNGQALCYRGILMPFSSDGDTIDFIYGVINWKTAGTAELPTVAMQPDLPADAEEDGNPQSLGGIAEDQPHLVWEDGPLADSEQPVELPEILLDEEAGLGDWLFAARETAEAVKSADHRTRAALYRALARAYDFALVAERTPEDYAELLEESGVKAQARAPMTPVVKLVFGIDYDKARLTEFAAALSYARRQEVAQDGFEAFIERQPGGLKALVAAERQARRPEPRAATKADAARERLRRAPSVAIAALPENQEFCLVVTRRSADGGHEAVAVIEDEALLEKAIRRAA